jgi:hypothetical protein
MSDRWLLSLAIFLGLAVGDQSAVRAGAWSQAKGHYYAKFSGIFYSSGEVYNDMGSRDPLGTDQDRFDSRQGFLYLEYGLLDRLTLVAQMNAGELVFQDTLVVKWRRTRGTGDADLGAKYQLVDDPLVLAPMVSFKVPTGYDQKNDPALGTGEIDLEFRMLAARSLYPWPLYIGAESGYRVRGGPYSNQVPYFIEVGASPHPKVFAKVYLAGKNTLTADDEESAGVVGASVQVSEGDFTKAGFNAAFNAGGPLWLDLLWEDIIAGENIGAGMSWGIGLSYSY